MSAYGRTKMICRLVNRDFFMERYSGSGQPNLNEVFLTLYGPIFGRQVNTWSSLHFEQRPQIG
jgi:hypothetical protein